MVVPLVAELDWRGKRYTDIDRGLRAVALDLDKDMASLGPLVRNLLHDYMRGVVYAVRERISTPYPHGTSPAGVFPGTLSKRSGKLLSGFTDAAIMVKGGASSANDIQVSFTLPGLAAVHERGAVIRPKNSQYLTIPLPAALDSRGVPIKPKAKDWPNTFVQRSKKGNLLIFRKEGKKKLVPLYVLKKSVTIPRRLAFEQSFEAGQDLLADKIAQEAVREFFS